MTVYLRPYSAETDTASLAELIARAAPQPLLPSWADLAEEPAPAGRIQFRVTAVEPGERIVGFGETGRDPWMARGLFWLDLFVAPEARGQGIGAMLFDDLMQFAWELGADRLLVHVDERIPEGLRFVHQRGFAPHPFGALLDLTALRARDYDCSEYCGLPDVPELAGLCA
jgi:GNAT superfamily N-acetyltransferase